MWRRLVGDEPVGEGEGGDEGRGAGRAGRAGRVRRASKGERARRGGGSSAPNSTRRGTHRPIPLFAVWNNDMPPPATAAPVEDSGVARPMAEAPVETTVEAMQAEGR